MNEQRSSVVTAKMWLPALLVACCLYLSAGAFAQKVERDFSVMPFGVKLSKPADNITLDQMLQTPALVTRNWEVVEFSISFMPEGRDFMGPFKMTGGPGITGMARETIQKLKDDGTKKVRVFIENIKALGPDRTIRNLSPIVFTSIN